MGDAAGIGSKCSLIALLLFGVVIGSGQVRAFNNDGHTHVLWQHRLRGETGVWIMRRAEFTTAAWITNDLGAPWQIEATADFNRDQHPDLFWRNPHSGENTVWLMDRTNRVALRPNQNSPTNFVVMGAGDFNHDGFPDVVWRDSTQPRHLVWFLTNGMWTAETGWLPRLESLDWSIAAIADFDHDNGADLILRNHRNGANRVWFMVGTNRMRVAELPVQPDLGFSLAAVGIFNSISQPDLFWRHIRGTNVIWRLHGTELWSTVTLPAETDTNWVAVGTGGYTNFPKLSAEIAPGLENALVLRGSLAPSPRLVVERKAFSPRALGTLSGEPSRSTELTQAGLLPGRVYELQAGEERLVGGVRIAAVEQRGKAAVVVDRTLASRLEREVDRFCLDLVGDGWTVLRTNVARHHDRNAKANAANIASIKALLARFHASGADRVNAVILIGHVPIPYSGFHSPDGHGGRALPFDAYYGDVDGRYTDSQIDFAPSIDGPREDRHENRPGDGKWDQNVIARNEQGEAELELAVGRIDFAKLPCLANREVELLRLYLAKNHRYRHKQLVFPERILAGSFFHYGPNPFLFGHALRHGSRWFGTNPRHFLEGDLFGRTNSALWAFQGGWGLPTGIQRPGGGYYTSVDLGESRVGLQTAFCSLFGSYFLDWDYTNSLLRTTLAQPNAGLGAMWFNPAPSGELTLEALAVGEPIATGLLRSINAKPDSAKPTYFSFLGDPTLRLQVLAPPSNLRVVGRGDAVRLIWDRSPETGEYYVYRSTHSLDGPWRRVTSEPIRQTDWTDAPPPARSLHYQVRAVKLISTGSGSFTNLSQGIFRSK